MSNPLIARFADGLALVEPSMATTVEANLQLAVAHQRFAELATVGAYTDFWQEDGGWCRPYIVVDGILQIPVKGVLVNEFPYAFYGWVTGYEYIWEAFKRGCADYAIGAIRGIALICNTPGGLVAGCWDTVDKMVALKEATGVPVAGFAHEGAYSAGYGIISVADKGSIYVSRTGGVGSIGTYTTHVDLSGAYDKAGIKITYVASDPSKVEGNSTAPLSKDAQARMQARVDELNDLFVAAVSRSRGLSEDVIRNDLKAYCYTATQAVSNGLADHIGSLEDATSAFADSLDDPSNNDDGDDEMADSTATSTVEQAVHEQAVATARSEGEKAGAAAAQVRIAAILGSEEATGRESLAKHFAFKSTMSAEDAVAALAEAPKAAAETPAATETDETADAGNGFDAAMSKDNPDVGVTAKKPESKDRMAALRETAAALGVAGLAPRAAAHQ